MKNLVSNSAKENQALSTRSHDLKSLWNYFFDFSGEDMGDLEPKIDVTDHKDSVLVAAEMPGIKEDDIDLKISDEGYLTISGEKRHLTEETSKNNYFSEISYGMFKRSIPLPRNLDYAAADAQYDDGVLTVKIPKMHLEQENYKKINVKKKGKKEPMQA